MISKQKTKRRLTPQKRINDLIKKTKNLSSSSFFCFAVRISKRRDSVFRIANPIILHVLCLLVAVNTGITLVEALDSALGFRDAKRVFTYE